MQFTAYEVICASVHGDWPDVAITLNLAAAEARLDGRDIDLALRASAGVLAYRIKHKQLQGLLLSMVIAEYPTNVLGTIEGKVTAMVKSIRKNGGDLFEAESLEELTKMLAPPSNVKPFIPYR